MGEDSRPALWLTVLMGVVFALMWSSAFSVGKFLVQHTPPFSVLFLRFLIAAIIAGSIALLLGQRVPADRHVWRSITILGLCQNTLYLGLYFFAMTRIEAGFSAIVASTMPLIVAAAAWLFWQERLSVSKRTGLALGFLGVVWIMGSRVTGGIDLIGLAAAIIGVIALATATMTVKRGDFDGNLLMIVACQMLIGALGCLPVALLLEDFTTFDWQPLVYAAFAYQVLVPGIAATIIWFALVRRVSASVASSFHFLNPIFGTMFAFILLGEPMTQSDMVGVVLVAAGILIVNWPSRKESAATTG